MQGSWGLGEKELNSLDVHFFNKPLDCLGLIEVLEDEGWIELIPHTGEILAFLSEISMLCILCYTNK